MLKTWDFEDRPSTQPRGRTTPDGTSLRRGTDAGGGSPILASRPTFCFNEFCPLCHPVESFGDMADRVWQDHNDREAQQ